MSHTLVFFLVFFMLSPAVSHRTRCLLPVHTHCLTMHCEYYTHTPARMRNGKEGKGGGTMPQVFHFFL
jgi:hypothetical protein